LSIKAAFIFSLIFLILPLEANAAQGKSGETLPVISPSEFIKFFPEIVCNSKRTSGSILSIKQYVDGGLASHCHVFYGSGAVLATIEHQPYASSLVRVLINNYVQMGPIENKSLTRSIVALEWGTVITSDYSSAGYTESIAILNNDLIVKVVAKYDENVFPKPDVTQIFDLELLSVMQPATSELYVQSDEISS
jgi:hypothetical protein